MRILAATDATVIGPAGDYKFFNRALMKISRNARDSRDTSVGNILHLDDGVRRTDGVRSLVACRTEPKLCPSEVVRKSRPAPLQGSMRLCFTFRIRRGSLGHPFCFCPVCRCRVATVHTRCTLSCTRLDDLRPLRACHPS